MKKKILNILLITIMVIGLTGCVDNKKINNSVDNSGEQNNKVDESSNNNSESKEQEKKYKTVNFNEQIKLDFTEITLSGASTGKEIRPDNPDTVYNYQSEQEGKTYFYVYGTIKNVSGENYEFAQNMYASFTFDDKYNYNGSITADEGGDFSYIYAYLDPLESEKFYIIASVPDELIETYKNVEVKFGFKNNFEYEYGIQENECDHLYSIKISR